MAAPAFNTVTWFQVGTDDPKAARDFYGDLFGWTFDPGTGYDLISYPGAEAPSGGIAHVPSAEQNSATFLVLVEDVAAVCARTERLGGKILVQPTTTPKGLVFAHLLDPSGNHFGVFTPPPAP
ncbi:VOC family protein [Actinomadura miaoliensis]|uniref:VOC family protein n=1 Tax=Actinomadura miaoliensis TaxID=430685 RepID=A0ABP7VQV2_9ACTN